MKKRQEIVHTPVSQKSDFFNPGDKGQVRAHLKKVGEKYEVLSIKIK
jgi:hypothetical protein